MMGVVMLIVTVSPATMITSSLVVGALPPFQVAPVPHSPPPVPLLEMVATFYFS
jgi:hypothetical protein